MLVRFTAIIYFGNFYLKCNVR